MKKIFLTIIFAITTVIALSKPAHAIQFDVVVLPAELFSVCDNYFCFSEPSEILANEVIQELDSYRGINTVDLATLRSYFVNNPELKTETEAMLENFEQTEKLNFDTLSKISKAFGVKSTIIISCYAITDRAATRRNLWEVLEVSSAFKITYPFNLTTTAVLTDNVNSTIMWSGKYNKTVSDTNGYFLALNQAQAVSHLEKIKQYFKNNVSKNISQNVHLRFFPKEIRTFTVKKNDDSNQPHFVPNALEQLSQPKLLKNFELENTEDEFIFDF